MMEGGRPDWLPYDVPTTKLVAEAILRETGRPPEEESDSDFRTVDAALRGDDPERWRAALEAAGFRYPLPASKLGSVLTYQHLDFSHEP
jgi:hypothetical protein